MEYSVELKPEALADLERLTQTVRNRLTKKISWLAQNFDLITPDPLTGNPGRRSQAEPGNEGKAVRLI